MARRKDPSISDALLDQLLAGADPKTAPHPGGLLDGLRKALADRALNAEMDHHLSGVNGAGNSRNGYGTKTVTTETGKFDLAVPRDRRSSFDPQLIARYQRRFPGFDESEEDQKRPQWGVFPTNRVDVRPRHEHPGDRRASPGTPWRRSLAGPDFRRHRRRSRGGPIVGKTIPRIVF